MIKSWYPRADWDEVEEDYGEEFYKLSDKILSDIYKFNKKAGVKPY